MTMTIKELQELMKLINRYNLVEFNMKDGEFEISIRSEQEQPEQPAAQQTPVAIPQMMAAQPAFMPPAPAAAASAAPAPAAAPQPESAAPDESKLVAIKSPMVGTFYRSSSPDKPPFAKVGDTITSGDVVCIVEAMKLFNEIEAEVSGKIVKVLVEDAQPVEYDQVLFMVEPA